MSQLFKLRGVFINKGEFQLQFLKLVPGPVFLCGILEPFSEGVEEVGPYYFVIIMHGVKAVQELSKVSDPSCYLFPFNVG